MRRMFSYRGNEFDIKPRYLNRLDRVRLPWGWSRFLLKFQRAEIKLKTLRTFLGSATFVCYCQKFAWNIRLMAKFMPGQNTWLASLQIARHIQVCCMEAFLSLSSPVSVPVEEEVGKAWASLQNLYSESVLFLFDHTVYFLFCYLSFACYLVVTSISLVVPANLYIAADFLKGLWNECKQSWRWIFKSCCLLPFWLSALFYYSAYLSVLQWSPNPYLVIPVFTLETNVVSLLLYYHRAL